MFTLGLMQSNHRLDLIIESTMKNLLTFIDDEFIIEIVLVKAVEKFISCQTESQINSVRNVVLLKQDWNEELIIHFLFIGDWFNLEFINGFEHQTVVLIIDVSGKILRGF
jgi:hypothetical protein